MTSKAAPALRPTLWRTCRILANRRRIGILRCLYHQGPLPVTMLAHALGMPAQVASQYLRALNARGLIRADRSGRFVRHQLVADGTMPEAVALVTALKKTFADSPRVVTQIYSLATGFTHPRRIEIVKMLHRNPCSPAHLRHRAAMSRAALTRHLRKLRQRSLVTKEGSNYRLVSQTGPLARALVAMAARS